MTTPTLPELEAEESSLILPYFDETMALLLGNAITAIAVARKSPVVINIRNANRCFFHASLPGSSAHNDNWARRKSNAALMTGHASLLIGMRHAAHNRTIEGEGWSLADFADSGGAVPLRVANAGIVAVATVSGLPQVEDHKMVVEAIRSVMG
jgi:uncharacterized protein (UPF0303 family)